MVSAIRHIGIVVNDMEKNLAFWTDVMGLKVEVDFWEKGSFIDTVENLKGVELHMIKLSSPDGSMIELLKDHSQPEKPLCRDELCDRGIRHIAFTVADAEASWKTFTGYGYETLSRPTVSPDGKARLFFARDPENNLLEIVQVI